MENYLAYDIETTGNKLYTTSKTFAYATYNPSEGADIRRIDNENRLINVQNRQHLNRLFENAKGKNGVPLVAHNAKFDISGAEILLSKKWRDCIRFHDTMVQSHVLQSDHPSHSLADLCWELAKFPKDLDKKVKSLAINYDYSTVPEHIMTEYQEADVFRTSLLHEFFYPMICKDERLKFIYDLEISLIPVTIAMEERGITLDKDICYQLSKEYRKMALDSAQALREMTGRKVNPGSGNDARWLLFNFAKLPVLGHTKQGLPSTQKKHIMELRENYGGEGTVIDHLMRYRSYDKGASMLAGYIDLADENGVIHPNIKTVGATTGRESCSNPNLQNVSKETGGVNNPFPVAARKAFRPRPGYVNIHIDYSGIEMRLLVHYSGEEEMIEIIRKGGDPHEPGCHIFYPDEYPKANKRRKKEIRTAIKNTNFGLCYGASALQVAYLCGLGKELGTQRFREYSARFPLLAGLARRISNRIREDGVIYTEYGRRIRCSREEPYKGTNYLIQGTAADILKMAQCRVYHYLQDVFDGLVTILLPIHDEIIIEWPRELLPSLKYHYQEIERLMTDFQFKVPIGIEVEVTTTNWSQVRPLTLE